ncbi:helix-turn-helix domain-containing protein [Cellulomonas sp. P24]|uniref:helix-turn-helix domain-containing protein n=1 Tax=Cellulomonas sp. P24 TaxID=2885206 RepID=UPI00216ACDB3|nr:helix-turn-helix domain-containing protein [Cellulomonas sp. P24]MCR6493612.1 helix-turn-helix domain-containing protein [Cellulomonas sp. P24]
MAPEPLVALGQRGAPEPLLRRLVGAILRTRREAQSRTLRDVALAARVSVAYLSEIERGRKEASSEVLVAVCRALGMRLVDLLAEAHDELVGRAEVVDLTARASRPGSVRPVSVRSGSVGPDRGTDVASGAATAVDGGASRWTPGGQAVLRAA